MGKSPTINQQIVADFAEGYSNFGLNPLMGRIVGLLIISQDPQSLDDMVETLEMSKGPISQICRRLKERGLIEKVWIPGDRKTITKLQMIFSAKRILTRWEKCSAILILQKSI